MTEKSDLSRRSFLERLMLGAAGVGLACSVRETDEILAMNDGAKTRRMLCSAGPIMPPVN
jgi:hypothetical protein